MWAVFFRNFLLGVVVGMYGLRAACAWAACWSGSARAASSALSSGQGAASRTCRLLPVDVVGGCCCVRFLLTLVLRGSGCCVTPTAPLSPSGRLSFLNWVFLEPLLQVARSGCRSGTLTVVDIVGLCVLWSCKFRTRSLQSTL